MVSRQFMFFDEDDRLILRIARGVVSRVTVDTDGNYVVTVRDCDRSEEVRRREENRC